MNASADLRAQLGTREAPRTEAETVAATAGGTQAAQAGGLLLVNTARAVKEDRGALTSQG